MFAIDERVGCIAVIDTRIDPQSPGLHPYSDHVVKYWRGRKDEFGNWEIPEDTRQEAREVCDRLNKFSSDYPAVFAAADLGIALLGGVILALNNYVNPPMWVRI